MAVNTASPKQGKVIDIPSTTVAIGTATDGGTGTTATVPFTPTTYTVGGPTTNYVATSTPGSFTGEGSSSPITVGGLTAATSYTFRVAAGNATGYGTSSTASNIVTVSAPPTDFESIATITPSGVSTITFSSIPATYKSLQIRAIGRRDSASTGGSANLRFNSDTGSNYAKHQLRGDGSTASASGSVSQSQIECFEFAGGDASVNNMVGAMVCDVIDYASTTKYKTVRVLNGVDFNGSGSVYLFSGVWMSTAAINSLTFYTSANYLTTTFALYGVK